MNFEELLNILKNTGLPVSNTHTKTSPKPPYIIYTVYSEQYLKADNKIADVILNIQIDLYTELTDKKSKKIIRNALDNANIPFDYKRFDEQRLIHHVFDVDVYEE